MYTSLTQRAFVVTFGKFPILCFTNNLFLQCQSNLALFRLIQKYYLLRIETGLDLLIFYAFLES